MKIPTAPGGGVFATNKIIKMPGKKNKVFPYRRKKQGKTDYKKRLHLLLSRKPRLVVRLTNQKIITQIIEFKTEGDLVRVGVDSSALKKYGWNFSFKSLPAAYLTGYLLGKKALQKNIKEAILDLGFKPPLKGNRIYACLKGSLDAGLNLPHSEKVFPSEERIKGKHIQDYGQKIKKFSKVLKNSLDPIKITETFQKTKQNIEKENIEKENTAKEK